MDAQTTSRRSVPFAVETPDRVPSPRYYDQAFYDLECEHVWPHVWQMACRLEEIPNQGDFVEYRNVGKSVIVIRQADYSVKAFHNACRHRGVELVEDRGNAARGFTCPFHGWCYGPDGENTYIYSTGQFRPEQLDKADVALAPCRVDLWGGCAFINHDDNAPPLRESLEPFASLMDAFDVGRLRTEWWYSIAVPVNWKLAMEAFMEGYHVKQTHPELAMRGIRSDDEYRPMRPGIEYSRRYAGSGDAKTLVSNFIYYLTMINEGMGGQVDRREIEIAERLRDIELPESDDALGDWTAKFYEALAQWGRDTGTPLPDFDALRANGIQGGVFFGFPHFFLMPIYGSASAYRVRPLGPEKTLFEIWALAPYALGEEPPPVTTPTPMAADDPRWPWIPPQDFSNLPKQQRGLHATGFDYMRLAGEIEGIIGNFHRLLDGYLAGVDPELLVEGAKQVSGRISTEIRDLGF